jgi:hypothetical protein
MRRLPILLDAIAGKSRPVAGEGGRRLLLMTVSRRRKGVSGAGRPSVFVVLRLTTRLEFTSFQIFSSGDPVPLLGPTEL